MNVLGKLITKGLELLGLTDIGATYTGYKSLYINSTTNKVVLGDLPTGGVDYFESVSFTVNSDSPVSDSVVFNDVLSVDLASLLKDPKISTVSFEVSTDSITYIAKADLIELNAWFLSIAGGVGLVRVIAVYGVGKIGSASVGFKYNNQ